jgi:hypothetical protein
MARPVVEWRFELVVSETMERLGELKQARQRSVQVIRNRPGGFGFTVPLRDKLFKDAEPIKTGIIAYRNDVPQYSGQIWTIDEGIGGGRCAVQGVGWFETLNHRILRSDIAYPRFTSPQIDITAGQIIFDDPVGVSTDANYYAGGLLTIANAQRDTWISEGTNTDKMRRVIAYKRGQGIGQAITAMTDVEAGFDFTIHPLTRQMDISNWDEYTDSTDRAVFGCNWGPNNMVDCTRQIDASTFVSRITAMGDYGGGLAQDLDAIAEYQLYEEMPQLGGVTDPNVLLGYAGGEILLRSRPRIIYTLLPKPFSRKIHTPEPFVDYNVGDKVIFSAIKDRIDVRGLEVRVFGLDIQIDEEGNERLGALQVTPG